MPKKQGFTLIELMIVVAIIGILAALSLSSYQTLTAKSQINEAIALLDGARTNTADLISIKGQFPLDKNELIGLNTQVNGKYGSITGIYNATSGSETGDIVYQFKLSGLHQDFVGKSVWYNYSGSAEWECRTNLKATLIPKMCVSSETVPDGS